jgi:hypothetical protein
VCAYQDRTAVEMAGYVNVYAFHGAIMFDLINGGRDSSVSTVTGLAAGRYRFRIPVKNEVPVVSKTSKRDSGLTWPPI